MSPTEELTRYMTAAGGVKPPGSDNTQLLYIEGSSLILKEWNGSTFGAQELIATDALPDSVATYLIQSDSSKRIIYISSTSELQSLLYDEDSEEWVSDEAFGQHKVHLAGKLAGAVDENGDQHVFFQDPSNNLVHLNDEWAPTVLSAKAAAGSPLSVLAFNDTVHLFYASSDNRVHCLTQQDDGSWIDINFTTYTFDASETPKRFIASPDENDALELFVLTEKRAMFRISVDGEKTTLGTVDEAGEWKPSTKEECFLTFAFCGWVHHGFHGGRRPRPRVPPRIIR